MGQRGMVVGKNRLIKIIILANGGIHSLMAADKRLMITRQQC
jgi:hypothetical protein